MLLRIFRAVVVAGMLIQLVPFGRQHTNPAMVQEPLWDSPRTRDLAKRACYNCHSSETVWPWYSRIAPVSWLTQRDVNGGRSHLNFSDWKKSRVTADDAVDEIQAGNMPPWFYVAMHPEAVLTGPEKNALMGGLRKSLDASKN